MSISTVTGKLRKHDVESYLDALKASLIEAVERGDEVFIETYNEFTPTSCDPATVDHRYDGRRVVLGVLAVGVPAVREQKAAQAREFVKRMADEARAACAAPLEKQ